MSVPVAPQLLLSGRNIDRLPAFLPLDLFELPIVRGTDRLTRNPDGSLTEEAYRQEIVIEGERGQEYRILIQGDSVIGRPYGFDQSVLIAIFTLVRLHKAWDGIIPNPSLGQIARTMGLDPNASGTLRRIRDAIDRFRRLMLVFTFERDVPTVSDILGGESTPGTPGKRRRVKTSPNEWLIRATLSEVDGTLQMESLAVNPIFIRQGAAGALLFIDHKIHNEQEKPVAQRLYCIAAALKAQLEPEPWIMPLDRMQALCADHNPTKKFKAKIVAASQDLIADGVLASFECRAVKRGEMPVVVMQPGPLLGIAGLLRGVGMMDRDDDAAHMLVLAEMGMPLQERRDLLSKHPKEVHWTLLYLDFAKEQPEAAGLKNGLTHPLPFFRKKFKEGGFDQETAFQKWLATASGRLPSAGAETPPRKALPSTSAAAPREPSAVEVEAADLWRRVLEQMTAQLDPHERVMLRAVHAIAIREDLLVCETTSPLALEFVETPTIRSLLSSAARVGSDQVVQDIAVGLGEPHPGD